MNEFKFEALLINEDEFKELTESFIRRDRFFIEDWEFDLSKRKGKFRFTLMRGENERGK